MSDMDLQAPWVGFCGEEYFRGKSEDDIIGYCEECGRELYEGDDVYDGMICEECYAKREEGEDEEEEYAGI